MRESFDVTTLVLVGLAVFVLWKLWSVLGARTGNEKPPYDPFAKSIAKQEASGDPLPLPGNVVQLPGVGEETSLNQNDNNAERWKAFAEPGSRVWMGLDEIAKADPGFVASSFLSGAKKAYELIVTAFAAGDRKGLKNLLVKDVYDSFFSALAARESRGEKVEMTFVSLDDAKIEDAQFRIPMAQISVRFLAKLISATRSKDGTIIDGSADKIVDMVDIWTFARDIGSRDPNWKLIATETGH